MNEKDMNFPSLDSLKQVQVLIDETSKALNDKSRTIETSAIPEVLSGALGTSAGGGIGILALYFGGKVVGLSAAGITSGLAAAGALVGGGMAAGIAVLAAPAVILGALGVGVSSYIKHEKLNNSKKLFYKEAIQKQTAILAELENSTNLDKERIEYLNSLNILLQAAIKDLEHDLGEE